MPVSTVKSPAKSLQLTRPGDSNKTVPITPENLISRLRVLATGPGFIDPAKAVVVSIPGFTTSAVTNLRRQGNQIVLMVYPLNKERDPADIL